MCAVAEGGGWPWSKRDRRDEVAYWCCRPRCGGTRSEISGLVRKENATQEREGALHEASEGRFLG